MSSIPPLLFRWLGDGFEPAGPAWAKRADQQFVVGETYRLEFREERSYQSHRHFFAAIHDAWQNLPEQWAQMFVSPDHLRRYALIRTGYADQELMACDSAADAERFRAYIASRDDFAIVTVHDAVVSVLTAKSQSVKAMNKAEFQESKQAVLDYVASLIGTSADTLQQNAGEAA